MLIPDWMHDQVGNVTLEEFLTDQEGNVFTHIDDHLQQLADLGVPQDKIDEFQRLIAWWF